MGTILKYIFYIALIIIIYLVGKGIFEGSINETTTVGQVVDDVKSGAADMAADVADTTKKAVEDTKSDSRNVAVPAKSSNQGAYNSTQGEFMMSENTLSDKAANAWDKTKEVSSDAWDKTKEVSGDAWEATKEGAHNLKEKVTDTPDDAAYHVRQNDAAVQSEQRADY